MSISWMSSWWRRVVVVSLSVGTNGKLVIEPFPVVKKIWSPTFVLVAGGYSAMLLGAFYYIVEVRKKTLWCQPFVWMGMNSITIYLTKNILGGTFSLLAQRFVGGDVKTFFNSRISGLGEMVISIVGLLLAFWYVHFLYKRKIFLRL